jgi:hypothetical protein
VVQFASLFTYLLLTSPGRFSRTLDADRPNSPFGFSPKISTPVENTVEKQHVTAEVFQKTSIFGGFSRGEG